MELISVIIPVYNVEKYLPKCIDSVMEQTYENIEIILVDDGSTDGSPSICDAYGEKDERIRVLHKANGGLSDARNAGLEIAKGAYIGFVDGDDWIHPCMYQRLYELLQEHNAELSVCQYRQVSSKDSVKEEIENGKVLVYHGLEAMEAYINEELPERIPSSAWCKLYSRGLIGNTRFIKGQYYEDILFCTAVLEKVQTTVYTAEQLYDYVVNRDGSIMSLGLCQRVFTDEIPIRQAKAGMLMKLGREDLAEMSMYYLYKKLIGYYVESDGYLKNSSGKDGERNQALKESIEEYAFYKDRLLQMIHVERRNMWRIAGRDFVTRGNRLRIRLFLVSHNLYKILFVRSSHH